MISADRLARALAAASLLGSLSCLASGLAACGSAGIERGRPAPGEAPTMMKREQVRADGSVPAELPGAPVSAPGSAPAPAAKPPADPESAPASASASEVRAYAREDWPHWIDADKDCQTARTEVLIAESYERVGYEDKRRCEVARGRWQCPYTGEIVAEVHLLDVDHLVPLANAHRSGGSGWTREQRRRYANDLDHPEHLVAVSYKANRSKGDKGPEAWLPPLEDARCDYLKDWDAIKRRWGLSMTAAEAQAVTEGLAICAKGGVPALPQQEAQREREREAEAGRDVSAGGECCRVCKKGKACGDGCIAKTSTCTKPPGCACDG